MFKLFQQIFQVLINIPVMLDIITNADNEIYEDNLLIITDAYQVG